MFIIESRVRILYVLPDFILQRDYEWWKKTNIYSFFLQIKQTKINVDKIRGKAIVQITWMVWYS